MCPQCFFLSLLFILYLCILPLGISFFAIHFSLFSWIRSLFAVSIFFFFAENCWVTWILLLELVPVQPLPWVEVIKVFLSAVFQESPWRTRSLPQVVLCWIADVHHGSEIWGRSLESYTYTDDGLNQPFFSNLLTRVLTVWALSLMEPCYRVRILGPVAVDWPSPLAHQSPCHWF